jgi:hypothetical protein
MARDQPGLGRRHSPLSDGRPAVLPGGLGHPGLPHPRRCSGRALRTLDPRELVQRIFPDRCVPRHRHKSAHLGAAIARVLGKSPLFASRTRSPSTSNDRQKRPANREGGRLFRCRHFAHPAAPSTRAQHIAIAQATRLTCSLSSVSGEGGEPAPLCTPAGLLLEVDVCERSIGTLGGQSGVPVPR